MALQQVATPTIVKKILRMKQEQPTMFAWEIREQLARQGACDSQSLPSVSSVNRILRGGGLHADHPTIDTGSSAVFQTHMPTNSETRGTLMRSDYQLFYPGSLGPLHISTGETGTGNNDSNSTGTATSTWNPGFYSSLYQATTLHLHHGIQTFTSLDTERLTEQQKGQNQVELKSSSSSMASSDDSLDKSDLDDNAESQDNYKAYQSSSIILELGQKIGSNRSAFVRHGKSNSSGNFDNDSRSSPTSSTVIEIKTLSNAEPNARAKQNTSAILDNSHNNNSKTINGDYNEKKNAAQPLKKRNPYSIEELLKKDENGMMNKRPRVVDTGIVQPCGIIVSKEQ
ncbi:hypothetical protein PV325_000622 [Microctonus aethiopoides]|nr:hypothetical protein PV325_000622 [Microctonus aethiopoides]